MKNIRPTTNSLNINLPDGTIVKSTHICDLEKPGLPHVLEGHIMSELTVESLVDIMQAVMHCIIYKYSVLCKISRKSNFNGI